MQIRFLGGSIFILKMCVSITVASAPDTENSSGVQMWQAGILPY